MRRAGKIIFILIIVLTISLRILYLIGPVDREAENSVSVIIESGSSGGQIARKLYNNNLIRSKKLFSVLVSIKGYENSLKAGIYNINPSYDMEEIIDLLVDGRIATFRYTIPEGFTVEEIARRLSVLTSYTEEEYLNYARQDLGRDYLNISTEDIKYALEGYLYPDTYVIPQEYNPKQIFDVMLSVYEKGWLNKLNQISSASGSDSQNYTNEDDNKKTTNVVKEESFSKIASQFTTHEIMTIASLIEEEARLDEEKALVAAVIYNRLKSNMLLQIDATIQYIMDDRKERVLYSDLTIDSPYNTYVYPGLPPGPISNPGANSIEAALNPADVDFLFYFARKDGSHVFTRSYQEHLKLQNEMRDN